MKKILVALVLVAVAVPAHAGTFGLFVNPKCNKAGYNICYRQYNAFSPAAFGSIYLNSVVPFEGAPGNENGGFGACPGTIVPNSTVISPATPSQPSASSMPSLKVVPMAPSKNETPEGPLAK